MNTDRRTLANAIRALAMDAVEQAKSGHPGMPMGMADIAEVLWNDYLSHNPANPAWANRDRFVVSNGHGSMLLYALLHLSGYALPLDELKRFRQLGSSTPGHPEYGATPGVETTTGPLGQGLANAVGMAIAERSLAAAFNRPGHVVVDHHTYVFLGDGCLMEGISHEACSLAGTLGLSKLVCFYDDNGISIDGNVDGWFTDDTTRRFEAYGWHVVGDVDGHDSQAIKAAIEQARGESEKPSLLRCKTIIGYGAPNKQGTEACHGAPLGADEVAAARECLGWTHPPFDIPQAVRDAWDASAAGAERERDWRERFERYRERHPALAAELERRMLGKLPNGWAACVKQTVADSVAAKATIATRKASQQMLDAFGPHTPELIGGSADLAGSNLTVWSGSKPLSKTSFDGNYIYFGVREFAMAAIANGLALHGGFIPYCATFLIFSEYARNALRMAALMRTRTVFVLTHDSVGLGEDGPTHQAVEQAATLRLMPNMSLWRPCDAVETAVAWSAAIEREDGPTCLLLSRQSLTHVDRAPDVVSDIRRGAYIVDETEGGEPQAIMIATGSEVALALAAARRLGNDGVRVRVVSMPSSDVFDAQPQAYRERVLPAHIRARVAVEAGVGDWWRKYVGLDGAVLSIDRFGESAPGEAVFAHFGFSSQNLASAVEEVLKNAAHSARVVTAPEPVE